MITEKNKKKIFYLMVIATFVMIAIYEYLTPNMSDDIIYGDAVATANSFLDLFRQEYEHYMGHSGRNVAHIILRFFLYSGNKLFFDVTAAGVFTLLSVLMYMNVDYRRKYDIRLYGVILMMLWFLDPTMSNSVFWETGACNYLFTGTIVVAYITFFRKHMQNDSPSSVKLILKMFVLGLAAGWCNENTSGGAIFFALLLVFYKWLENDRKLSFVKPWMISAFIGNIIGFGILLLSPGNTGRAEVTEEAHTGLLALMARFLKIVLNIKNNYLLLVLMFVVALIYIAYMSVDKRKFLESTRYMRILALVALVTAFSLLAVPSSQLRTYYGASLFLMMAVANGIGYIANTRSMSGSASDEEHGMTYSLVQTAISGAVAVCIIILGFTYIEEGANLARIKREMDERDEYLLQLAADGEVDVSAPRLRPEWENRFTFAYDSDIDIDWHYWINVYYSQHYGFDTITGVEREEWTEY